VRTHLTPHIGRVALTQLSPQHVQRLIAILQAAGLNASTVQRVHSTLRSALATAVRWQLIPRNVAQVVTPPPVHEYEAMALTVAQAKQFLSAIRGERNEALYLVTLMLGVRRGEVLALRWQDVDLEHGTLRVVGTLHTFKDAAALDDIVRTRSGLVVARLTPSAAIMQPKTKRSKRVLPLSPALITALHVHGLRQGSERARMGERWQEHGLVFPSSVGTPYNARNVIRMFERTVQAAGLPPLRFHDLRHSCASFLAASDPPTPPRVAMEILGHANIHTTLQIYTKALDQGTRAAAMAMDALLRNEDVSA
jgi:integrase